MSLQRLKMFVCRNNNWRILDVFHVLDCSLTLTCKIFVHIHFTAYVYVYIDIYIYKCVHIYCFMCQPHKCSDEFNHFLSKVLGVFQINRTRKKAPSDY